MTSGMTQRSHGHSDTVYVNCSRSSINRPPPPLRGGGAGERAERKMEEEGAGGGNVSSLWLGSRTRKQLEEPLCNSAERHQNSATPVYTQKKAGVGVLPPHEGPESG